MKYLKILLLIVILTPLNMFADKPKGQHKGGDKDRTEWFRKLKEAKHNFMIKELDLTEAQRADFFRLYDAKEAERHEAERKVRTLEKEIKKKGAATTEDDYDRAIAAQYQLNHELAKIESKYESEFRKVITKRQLYKLRHVEFEFQRKLMKQEKEKK